MSPWWTEPKMIFLLLIGLASLGMAQESLFTIQNHTFSLSTTVTAGRTSFHLWPVNVNSSDSTSLITFSTIPPTVTAGATVRPRDLGGLHGLYCDKGPANASAYNETVTTNGTMYELGCTVSTIVNNTKTYYRAHTVTTLNLGLASVTPSDQTAQSTTARQRRHVFDYPSESSIAPSKPVSTTGSSTSASMTFDPTTLLTTIRSS